MEKIVNKDGKPMPSGNNNAANEFLAEQEARHYIETLHPGRPTGDGVMLQVRKGDLKDDKQGRANLDAVVFEVIDIGPEVIAKNKELPEEDRIEVGKWVQMKPSGQILVVDWGDRTRIIINAFSVALIFSQNPVQLFKDEVAKQKMLMMSANKGEA